MLLQENRQAVISVMVMRISQALYGACHAEGHKKVLRVCVCVCQGWGGLVTKAP